MPAIVVLLLLTAGVAAGAPAASSDAAGATAATGAVAPPSASAEVAATATPSNGTANDTTADYQPIEPPQNWTKGPVLETEIDTGPSISIASSDGLTRQFLTSGPRGLRLMTFERRVVGDNVEVWVARNLSWGVAGNRSTPSISDAQAKQIAEAFNETIRPKETEIFGKPKPRDGSEALIGPPGYYNTTSNAGNTTVILVQNIRDRNYYNPDYPLYVVGYYSQTIGTYTDRNVVTLDAYDWSSVTEQDPKVGLEGTLAHEYQHLIHADLDGDETSWINEGMSDYAEYAVGYGLPESHVSAYEQLPSNSLTNWEDQGPLNVLADYGVAASWMMYLDDRYGQAFIGNLAEEDANGIRGVEATLEETGAKTDFYGLYQDYTTAVITDNVTREGKRDGSGNGPPWAGGEDGDDRGPDRGDGHPGNTPAPFGDQYDVAGVELDINTSGGPGTAGAWGTDYRTIDTSEKGPVESVTLSGINYTETEWSTATDPVDGNGTVLYSGSGNLLDRHAIVEANLSGDANATLTFESLQRIEANWDYGFVQVSTDGGETWHSLSNNNTDATPADAAHPRVVRNLPGLTGTTDGWTTQRFDLSQYAGNESVLISFRYVTDWAVAPEGWYVRNVSVAGESVPTDTIEPYMSEREATGNVVEYQFTFVGFTDDGKFRVKQLDAQTFAQSGQQQVERFFHRGNFDRVVVASTWAAQTGESGRLPYSVNFTFRNEHGDDRGPGHGDDGSFGDDGDDPFDGEGPFGDDGNSTEDDPFGDDPWNDSEDDGDRGRWGGHDGR